MLTCGLIQVLELDSIDPCDAVRASEIEIADGEDGPFSHVHVVVEDCIVVESIEDGSDSFDVAQDILFLV